MINNRKAPRFNTRKFRKNIVSEELWKQWKEKTGYELDFKTFRDYWNLIAERTVSKVIQERDGVKLGAGTGDIYIGYIVSPKRKPIDYKTSEEYNTKIRHENWENNGKMGKIIYGTRERKYIYRRHNIWAFKAHRLFKNKASASLRSNPERYKNSIEKRK